MSCLQANNFAVKGLTLFHQKMMKSEMTQKYSRKQFANKKPK